MIFTSYMVRITSVSKIYDYVVRVMYLEPLVKLCFTNIYAMLLVRNYEKENAVGIDQFLTK